MRGIINPVTIALSILLSGALMSQCSRVDDTLGAGLIPKDQQMSLRRATFTSMKTYLAQSDQVPSNNTSNLHIGNVDDPVFGRMRCGTMTQFLPGSNDFNSGKFFGYKPVVDSSKLWLYISEIHGDPTIEQTFNIYALTNSLKKEDSTYYFNIPIEEVVDFDKPIFSFPLANARADELVAVKLEPTAYANAFLEKLVNLDTAIYRDPATAFHEEFYGLYIAPAPGSPDNAAVYTLDITYDLLAYTYSLMTFYVHNYEEDSDPLKMEDEALGVAFIFDDYFYPNLNINKVEYDYPPDIAAHINDTISGSALEKTYIQSLGGVATYLKLPDEFMDELNALKHSDGITYSRMIVNQAKIYFPIEDPTVENMDMAPPRLGMYYGYDGYYPLAIIDYMYLAENTDGATIPYGGYLNRSNGYYVMDISAYMTRIIERPEKTPRSLWVGPEANARAMVYDQVALKGSEHPDNPVMMELTYTLIK